MHFLLQNTTPTADNQSLPQTTKPHHLQPLLFKARPFRKQPHPTTPQPLLFADNRHPTTDYHFHHRQPLPTADYHSSTQSTSPHHRLPLTTADNSSLPQTTTPYRKLQPYYRLPRPTTNNHSLPQTATPFCRQPLPPQIKQILNELIEEFIRFRHIRHEGQLQICINLIHNLPTIIKKRKVPNKNEF